MSGATLLATRRCSPTTGRGWVRALTVVVLTVVAGSIRTAGAVEPAAAVVQVRLPIVGTRDTQVETAILKRLPALRSRPGERGVLVLEFGAAADGAAAGSDFGRAFELARFLTSDRLAGVKTVAFLPEGSSGHAVLVAIACEEIVMPPDATLGPADGGEGGEPVDEAMRAAYTQIAARRRTVPPAVALGLLDPGTKVARVSTDDGEQFVPLADVERLRRDVAVLGVEELAPVPLVFTGRRGRELGFVRLLAKTPAELARGLGLAERSLVADPAQAGGWRPVQVALSGAVTADAVARVRGRLERAVAGGANFICLRIDSAGGSPEQSLVLATWLAGLDPADVKTVAYVPREARGDAALVAAACDELVMERGAVLGGDGAAAISPRQADSIAAAWRAGVARQRDRSWSLPVALAVPGLVVRRGTEQGTGRSDCFTDDELESRPDRDAWQLGAEVGVGPIQLTADKAESLGMAAHVVDDVAGFRQAYGLDATIVASEAGWAEELLTALASPGLAWLLLLIGGAGLFIELKTPGFGFGGFVSLVAFIIYFWSQYLHGTSGWLEVLLFLAGLVCVAAEILVLPGFGVLGLGGGLLVIAAIVLASQSFVLPTNDYQIRQMQESLLGILAAVVGTTAVALVARRWLPSTPVLRDVLLVPPASADDVVEDPFADLVGLTGTTTTRLAPAGKALVAGVVRDVVADDDLVEPGHAVRVVAVRGGRVFVRRG